MNDAERERLYREALAARRAGETCPLCGTAHSALSSCPVPMGKLPPSARTTDPETSHDAAKPTPSKEALRFTCLAFYARVWPGGPDKDGLVDDDLAVMAGFPDGHESYRRRGSDLRALGWTEWWVEEEPGGFGTPVRRRTSLGASARVAVITPLGRRVLAERGS